MPQMESQSSSAVSSYHVNLTAQLYRKLPRELRDEVYSHLWEAEDLSLNLPQSPYLEMVSASIALSCREVAKEAVQWYYENHEIFQIQAPEKLNSFLTHDVFRVGLAPKDCSLRGLTVDIDVQHAMHDLEQQTLLPMFHQLTKLKLKKGFTLELRLQEGKGGSLKIVDLHRLGLALKPLLDALKAKDATILARYTPDQVAVGTIDVSGVFGDCVATWVMFIDELLATPELFTRPLGADMRFAMAPFAVRYQQMQQNIAIITVNTAKIDLENYELDVQVGFRLR
ncbi:hypothetical protein BDV96DRAFT_606003 [Lophiotrema nucula]|uniref:F-box domain-containing protein n=1 Tax=Lophiotrema nucula TaxID=690887 RepID=A0A6A5YLN6_9PLEO|nr:hypothetical protein BDV96DRAFT_606003 [Lophiotrema nucula]